MFMGKGTSFFPTNVCNTSFAEPFHTKALYLPESTSARRHRHPRPGNHLQSLTPYPIFSSLNAIYLAMGGRNNDTKLRARNESPCRARKRFRRPSICLSNPMDVG